MLFGVGSGTLLSQLWLPYGPFCGHVILTFFFFFFCFIFLQFFSLAGFIQLYSIGLWWKTRTFIPFLQVDVAASLYFLWMLFQRWRYTPLCWASPRVFTCKCVDHVIVVASPMIESRNALVTRPRVANLAEDSIPAAALDVVDRAPSPPVKRSWWLLLCFLFCDQSANGHPPTSTACCRCPLSGEGDDLSSEVVHSVTSWSPSKRSLQSQGWRSVLFWIHFSMPQVGSVSIFLPDAHFQASVTAVDRIHIYNVKTTHLPRSQHRFIRSQHFSSRPLFPRSQFSSRWCGGPWSWCGDRWANGGCNEDWQLPLLNSTKDTAWP